MAEGKPGHGDRGAWNVADYATEHASDINAGALTRHLPAPGTAGDIVYDDGTNWQSGAATDLAALIEGVRRIAFFYGRS